MDTIDSENGVICTSPAWKDDQTVTLEVPKHLLTSLQAAWQGVNGLTDHDVLAAVRDLFDGEDGALQYLARIGIATRPC